MDTPPGLRRKLHTPITALLENIPFLLLIACGTYIMASSLLLAGFIYFCYFLFALGLYMAAVCPYCSHLQKRNCAAGYHYIAGVLFRARPGRTFKRQFRRYQFFLYPLWMVPPAAGLYLLLTAFHIKTLWLLLFFCLDGFVMLPLLARYVTCKYCENKEECPRYAK